MYVKKIIVLCLALVAVFFFLGQQLSPLDPHFFSFHDNTQAARLQEFAFNIQNGMVPPRVAPHFSFNNGFPVFNFYAPFTYWVGGILHLAGFSSALSLKLVLLGGLFISFISFFLFASLFFGLWGGLLGAVVYSSSLWMAVEIFVRGNVGELWFIALLPLCLYFLKRNDAEKGGILFLTSCIAFSFLFSVHNVLSLISVFFVSLVALTMQNKKKAFLSIGVGLILSSYFLIPAVLENKLTYANEIASRTKYTDHFLCAWQLWRANKWSFGGSGIGCLNDDMSFQIGKVHILLAGIGIGVFLLHLITKKKKKDFVLPALILGFSLLTAFLTIDISKPLWDLFAPMVKVFQFPWRLLPFVVFGVAFFASYSINLLKNEKINAGIAIVISLGILYSSHKFFSKPWNYSTDEYSSMYLSDAYIQQRAAYEIPEYFPRSGNYSAWRAFDKSTTGFDAYPMQFKVNTPFYKELVVNTGLLTLPIHYFPFWEIRINGVVYHPKSFDSLGRPILSNLPINSTITVRYTETLTEKAGDIITILAFIALVAITTNKHLWKKMNTILQ
jgi:hypothetical protein